MAASVKLETSSSLTPDWKAAVEVLIRGARDSASLLGTLLQDQSPGSATRVITEEIVNSISRAVLLMDDCEKLAVPTTVSAGSPCSDDGRSEASGQKRKFTPARRVNRSRSQPKSCTRITTKTMDDGYTWRKYGQKQISNTTFPRSYYRCVHKKDRGCQATSQVQQSEEDPTMLVMTYMGEHTCISDTTETSISGSYLSRFGSDSVEPPISASLPSPKMESDEEVLSSASLMDSSLSEELVLPEGLTFEMSSPTPTPSLPSATLSPVITFELPHDCLELDFMGDHEIINLDELFNFNSDVPF